MTSKNNRGCLSLILDLFRSDDKETNSYHYKAGEVPYPYALSKRFLTEAEHSFYLVSKKVLGEHYMVCPQVSLSAVFLVTTKRHYWSAFHRISQKRVDFIVCDATTMRILFGIELDDASHQRPDRIDRDVFVNTVFEMANLPLVRVKAKNAYSTGELEGVFSQALLPGMPPIEKPQLQPQNISQDKPIEYRVVMNRDNCPKCGAKFNIRVSNAGPHVGQKFYVCSKYPECKTSILME